MILDQPGPSASDCGKPRASGDDPDADPALAWDEA